MIWPNIFGFLALLSCALQLWQWWMARRFPLHQRVSEKSFSPSVTLLKPLKGLDAETKACLQSWLRQDYAGPVQILFGVASSHDPVCEIVRELLAQNVKVTAELVICPEQLGSNAKVSTLIQLSRRAENEIIIVSDADVRVPEDFLSNVVQPLRKPEAGLVNCFYHFANPSTLAMRWEAIAVNADFWSQVLQSQSLKPIDFALGAVMVIRRESLRAIGGFESLADYLADDYQLGNRVAQTGKQIVISPLVVECWESPKTWSQVWNHQLRWARTIRACQPVPFFFSILSNATLWPLLWIFAQQTRESFTQIEPAITDLHLRDTYLVGHPSIPFWTALLLLVLRIIAALKIEKKLTKSDGHYAYFWLVPIKDLLGVAIWALSFFGNRIEWHGEKLRLVRGGKLQKL